MIDAGQAFRYARGAMWHLECAVPELQAAAGGATRAAELVRVAANHVEHAAGDLIAAGGGAADAATGQMLLSLARHTRSGAIGADAAADLVATARLHVQQSIDAIVPRLESPQELLPLAPAATAPRSELALIDDVASARLFRPTSTVQRAQIKRILSEGTIDPDPVRWVGGYGNGNGAMPMVRVRHFETPHLSVLAVQRPPTAQAAQEEAFAELTERAGTDQHFAPVVRREDGSALVLAVPGGASWDNGVHGGDDVRHVLTGWYRDRFPSLPDGGAREAGYIDFDKLRAMDYEGANPDRNGGSPLVESAPPDVHYIDNGFAGRGETADPLMPGLKSQFMGGMPGEVSLHPTAVRELVEGLTDDALAEVHAVLRRGPDGDLPPGHAFALAQDASTGYLEAMRARRDQIATGGFRYHPIDLNANPLAHMDWLQTQVGKRAY